MDQGLSPLSGGEKYQVIVHVNANNMGDDIPFADGGSCHIDNGHFESPISKLTMLRLACDASLVTSIEDSEGNVLNVGRKTRTVPPSIRRALNRRDGHCRFPGCCDSRFVDAHHIHHWCDGGETKMDNLVLLCRHHHRLLHQGGFSIENKGANDLVFKNTSGKEIKQALYPQFEKQETTTGTALAIEVENEQLGLEIDSDTAITSWLGGEMDYSMAVEGLLKTGIGL